MNYTLSDEAVRAGIKIGGMRESQTIAAIYDKCQNIFMNEVFKKNICKGSPNENYLWEAVEAFYYAVRNEQIHFTDEAKMTQQIQHILARIETQDFQENHLQEKPVWDLYLASFNELDENEKHILIKTFGEDDTIEDLSKKLVARGIYGNDIAVKKAKTTALQKILAHL